MKTLRLGTLAAMLPAMALVPGGANAQALRCNVPAQIEVPRPDLPDARQPRRIVPIGGYTLALSWSPQFCKDGRDRTGTAFQCGTDNRFGMVLHGLWPDGKGAQWPQYCRATGIVPPAVVRQMLCLTPSAQLIQHEWAKHGTCMSRTPAEYFSAATRLFNALRMPDMDALSRRPLTVAGLRAAFARENPGMPARAVHVRLTRDGWLDELWLCLDTRMRYVACRPRPGAPRNGDAVSIWRGRR